MQISIEDKISLVAPSLFSILFILICLNLVMYLSFYRNNPVRITKQMCQFWSTQLLGFLIVPLFSKGNLLHCIPYSANFFTTYIMYRVFFADLKPVRSFHLFSLIFALGWVFAVINELLFANFTLTTLPVTLAESIVQLYMLYLSAGSKEKEFKSLHHKWIFVIVSIAIIHNFNFSFFRNDPAHFMWGMTLHILLIMAVSIVMATFHTFLLERTEKERLSELVEQKTLDLNLKYRQLEIMANEKAHLFRILLHDISNPMTTIINSLSILLKEKMNDEKKNLFTINAYKSAENIIGIIGQVRTLEAMKTGKINLKCELISLRDAFEMAQSIFSCQYDNKGVKLLVDYPQQEILFQGNHELFVNSVLCNLLSNSLKFSQPGTQVLLSFKIENQNLIVTIQDQGMGMKQEQIAGLFEMDKPTSSIGTMGEVGTGFGMPLIKNYLDQVKGNIQIISKTADEHQVDHGTRVELKFGLVENVESNQPGQVTH